MALARIITRSQVCSRELALDLLARGYAVEIVAPESVPDNLADLELRLEEEPGDQLAARVRTGNAVRSLSLEFLHHLRAPTPQFVRRAPEPDDWERTGPASGPANRPRQIAVSAFPDSVADEVAPPVATPQESRLAPVPTPAPLEPAQSQPAPTFFAVPEPTIPRPQAATITATATRARQSPMGGSLWRAAAAGAALLLVAAAVGLGWRRSGPMSAHISNASAPDDGAVAPAELGYLPETGYAVASPAPTRDLPQPIAAVAAVKTNPKADAYSDPGPKAPLVTGTKFVGAGVVATATKTTAAAMHQAMRREGDALIAHDTVVYLDPRFKPPAAAAKSRLRVAKPATDSQPSSPQ